MSKLYAPMNTLARLSDEERAEIKAIADGYVAGTPRPLEDYELAWVGREVAFQEYVGEDERLEVLVGTIEEAFVEPPAEDPKQRLNFRVRTPQGVFTPYAYECQPWSA